MFRSCNRLSLVLMLLALSAFAPRAFAEVIPFNTQFKGSVVSDDGGSPVAVIVVQLAGHAPGLGSFQETLTHHFNVVNLSFTGSAVFTFFDGTFTTQFSGQGYTTPFPDWITFNVTHTIVSGTGVFQGATGSFVGVGGAFDLVTGEDVGGYQGSIHIPGNLTPFGALFQGSVISDNTSGSPLDVIVVQLAGKSSPLGSFQETLTHYFNVDTLAFTGSAVFTFFDGTFTTQFSGQGFPTMNPDWITFEVTHNIVGGTGKFQGATGTFYGVNGQFNVVTGQDMGGYKGTLSIIGGH